MVDNLLLRLSNSIMLCQGKVCEPNSTRYLQQPTLVSLMVPAAPPHGLGSCEHMDVRLLLANLNLNLNKTRCDLPV